MKSGNLVDLARLAAGLTSLLFSATSSLPAQPEAVKSYYVYACAESEDEVAIVRYGPSGAGVVKVVPVGSFPTEIEGPHGINVAPDGRHWYVTLAHGKPFGTVHKYETGSNLWLADVRLGMYPATLDISATTGLLYAVNFNLHGKMSPGTISVVDTQNMIEVKQIKTGVMPHGSRLNPAGDRHYSVNMMNDEVVEVDALAFAVLRRLQLPGGKQQGDGSPATLPTSAHSATNLGHAADAGWAGVCHRQQIRSDLRGRPGSLVHLAHVLENRHWPLQPGCCCQRTNAGGHLQEGVGSRFLGPGGR